MGKILIGKVAFTPQGLFDANREEGYEKYDVVYKDLMVYISLIDKNHLPLSDVSGWKRLMGIEKVLGRMLADGAITSDKISGVSDPDGAAVTTVKIAAGAVTTEKLANESITGDEIEAGAVKAGKIATDAVQTRNIKDQSVTNEKMMDGDLSWEKLNAALQNIITTSAGQHGIPLSTEFGDSDLLGVTQKTLTESRDSLQQQIDEIVGGGATTGLSLSTTMEFVGTVVDVVAMATCSQSAVISIRESGGEPDSSSGDVMSFSRTFAGVSQNKTFVAGYSVRGVVKPEKSASISFVYPLYYGAGDAYTDLLNVAHRASKRATLGATYNVAVTGAPTYIWFVIPKTMGTIHTAKMGGFDFSLNAPESVQVDGVDYYVYRTPQKQEVNSYAIVLT